MTVLIENPMILKAIPGIDKYTRKITAKAHNFNAFVRFKEIAPLSFYAPIELDHNILPLILNHFTRRFSDQKAPQGCKYQLLL